MVKDEASSYLRSLKNVDMISKLHDRQLPEESK